MARAAKSKKAKELVYELLKRDEHGEMYALLDAWAEIERARARDHSGRAPIEPPAHVVTALTSAASALELH